MNVLLFAPEYRPNLSSMIRSAEFYGLDKVYIYDKNNLLLPPTHSKKARADMAHMAKVWTAGAIDHIEIIKIETIDSFLLDYEGRKIATLVDEKAQHLNNVQFESNDLLIFGSEKEGLPTDVLPLIDQSIYIPALGHTPCLNVAVTFGIVLHQALRTIQ
ncbi:MULTISPECIES: TrmH family RNA methyltransferase [unclassified Aureispira]|uniref:TrmH family RNA methyltransferase n=1 Tax=unclassified Aureispira TaxID=2649989 RepID=UPI000907A463|nr:MULTISPECIES: TrmH family RNA methyltransferase [unclassified Aureispira]WMX15068.1 TrmH family RNA methyltransferase [Aureispira sp. CCB-E]